MKIKWKVKLEKNNNKRDLIRNWDGKNELIYKEFIG